MKKVILVIALELLISSCSIFKKTPQQRLNKLIEESPELLQKDSIKLRTEFVTYKLTLDTSIVSKDSVIEIDKPQFNLKITKHRDGKTTIHQEVKPQKATKDTTIYYNKVIVQKVKSKTLLERILNTPLYLVLIIVGSILLIIKYKLTILSLIKKLL